MTGAWTKGRARWRSLARADRLAAALLGLLGAVGLLLFLTQTPLDSRHDDWRGPHITSDGWYYYHELRSLALDGDLDFTNEYRDFGNWYGFERGQNGRPRNPFGIGPALAWLPGFAVGHIVALVTDHDEAWRRPHGYSPPEQLGSLLVSYLAGWATLVLSYVFARRMFPPLPALLGAIGAALGGPLLWYTLYEPSMPHVLAAATATLFLVVALPLRRRGLVSYATLGFVGGLAMLMRPQHAVLLAIPAVELAVEVYRRRGDVGVWRDAVTRSAMMLGVALVTFCPQLLAWKAIYDQWVIVPQGTGFMRWGDSMWSEVLFSSRNGLFTSTPILWLCLPGVLAWGRRYRAVAAVLATFFISQAYINGAAWDWWAGGAYGGRRMLGSSLLFAVGVAACVAPIVAGRRHGRTKSAIAVALVATFVVPQLAVLRGYKAKEIKLDDPSPIALKFAPVLGPRLVSLFGRLGNPFAFPANAVFAVRHGVPLSRYDYAVGPYLLNERVPTTNPKRPAKSTDDARLTSPDGLIYAGRGVTVADDGAHIERRGTLLVPLNRPGELKATIFLYCTAPAAGSIAFNGNSGPTFDSQPPGRRVAIEVPADQIRRGINELEIEVDASVVIKHVLLTEGDDWPPAWTLEAPSQPVN